MADRLARELDRWSQRTLYRADDDLVFAHPQSGSAPISCGVRFPSAPTEGASSASHFGQSRRSEFE